MPDRTSEESRQQDTNNLDIEIFWEQHKKELWTRCVRWTHGDQDAADEIIAQTALNFVKQRTILHTLDNPHAWFARVTWNNFIDICRFQSNFVKFSSRYNHERMLTMPTSIRSPEDCLLHEELISQIGEAIEKLPDTQRQAFEMRVINEDSYQQVTKTLSISYSSARKRVQLARKTLKRHIKDYIKSSSM